MKFDEPLEHSIIKKEFKFSETEKQFIKLEIENFLKKGIIEPVIDPGGDIQFVTNIFLRPKADNSFRTILNLKDLNYYVSKISFKLSTLRSCLKLVKRGSFFAKVDLKDAYFSCPIAKCDRRLFRFTFEGKVYEFVCLPQGFTDAPRVFTKLTKPILSLLRRHGFISSIYIDDLLLIGEDSDDIDENVRFTIDLFDKAGFTVHPDKSVLQATTIIVYLGFIIDSMAFTVKPTEDKVQSVVEKCFALLRKMKITIRELAEIIGIFVALEPGNVYAPLFYKRLELFKNSQLKAARGDYGSEVMLPIELRSDILWWTENAGSYPKPIAKPPVDKTFSCDASASGWGAHCKKDNKTTEGIWSSEEYELHINEQELLAVKFSLQSLCNEDHDIHIKVFSDNTTTVQSLNKMNSNKPHINKLVREIWLWCKDRNIQLTVTHIAGKRNVKADTASRSHNFQVEWSLHEKWFSKIEQKYAMDVDLFASRLNFKLPCYVSWKPDPGASAVNAFHLLWDYRLAYCFPPFCMILSVLQKVDMDKAEIIIVVPLWPTATWFSKLLSLLIEEPWVFRKSPKMLVHPMDDNLVHPLSDKMNLMVCRLSGKSWKIKEFQDKLPTLSLGPGGKAHSNNTTHISKNGSYFVRKGKKIRFIRKRI